MLRLGTDCTDAQADLSLRWAHLQSCRNDCDPTQLAGSVLLNLFMCNIGIKHGFSCTNIRQVPRVVLKTEAGGRGFQHLSRDLANVNALKIHVRSLYCMKTENVCYILRYFLHYFVSPFHRCLANATSTDYALSRAGQYTSRNGSKSVAPVRSY